MITRVIAFFVGIAAGIGLAMLVGWTLLPMDRQEITPASMRADYQAEYVRLAAATYQAEGDLARAQARLRALDAEPYTAPLVELTERWISERRDPDLILPLVELAQALDVATTAMVPYNTGGER
jgi:hypothetical protein